MLRRPAGASPAWADVRRSTASRGLVLAGFTALSLACGRGRAPVPQDRCAALQGSAAEACWLGSLSQDPDAGPETLSEPCLQIVTPSTRAWCLASAAAVPRNKPEQSRRICDLIDYAELREDCHFGLLESMIGAYTPLSWVDACRQWTGRFHGECLRHGNWEIVGGLLGEKPPWLTQAEWREQLDVLSAAQGDTAGLGEVRRALLAHEGVPGEVLEDAQFTDRNMARLREARSLHWRDPDEERWW